jgi:hypothetical protein
MSFMTVPNSRWEGMSFLYCDVGFNFVSDMCIEVTSIDVDIFGRIVILLGQGVEEFFKFTLTRAHIHACNVEWARYQG